MPSSNADSQRTIDAESPSPWVLQLLDKLALIGELQAKAGPMRFAKTISSDELEAFESQYQLRLPEDYREFLLYVGNGGCGPDGGIAPLGDWGLTWTNAKQPTRQGEVPPRASLLRPFPLESAWFVAEEPRPFAPDCSPHDGCLELCDLGGYYSFLVVNGAHRGEVWLDYSAALEATFAPVASSFSEWFESQWLDQCLVSYLSREIQNALSSIQLAPSSKKKRGNRDREAKQHQRVKHCRYHEDILRWRHCFVIEAGRPFSLIHRAWLELYLAYTTDCDTKAEYGAFDAICEQAPAFGVNEKLLTPLLQLRHSTAFA
ncbi:MAG: SMI1/KNR4 family protein [Myxococcota bacterium]|jgi:hypothetical protein|nr:SMI1/KNR4 family protein [Myxococcota bacterium]